MLDLNPIKKRLANPPMYRGVVMGNDLIVDIGALVAEVERVTRLKMNANVLCYLSMISSKYVTTHMRPPSSALSSNMPTHARAHTQP